MGAWKSWKHKVETKMKHALIVIGIVIGVGVGAFLLYKFVIWQLKKSYIGQIAQLQAELDIPIK